MKLSRLAEPMVNAPSESQWLMLLHSFDDGLTRSYGPSRGAEGGALCSSPAAILSIRSQGIPCAAPGPTRPLPWLGMMTPVAVRCAGLGRPSLTRWAYLRNGGRNAPLEGAAEFKAENPQRQHGMASGDNL